ncbi:DUF4245 family protein [Micromonospora sp. ALFpr18c]|uniref:DUF4245 domain-containing protein n=1 Tax=unclassified Micromonospora TaxID=2617518 RepID=UPI00124BA514|nr:MULTISPECIES: DUF4245 domain-containing protein [unclassified Micromonospora]KAB1934775.1 DUF4245 family protein [Micromonospora sp. ALFpr18c]MDG4760058.1 DUF4245 family protein [Micromonospora sp. WMMD710]
MEPAQPADRVPADRTPPDGQPPADVPAGEPAVTSPTTPPDGEPALVEPDPSRGDAATDTGERPAPPPRVEAARSERSPKDMAISLLVLLVPIALLLAFYRGFLGGDQASTVDPAPAIEQARSANVFPVSQPQGLGSDWRTVSARYQSVEGGANLRIGYLTPEGRGVQLVQSSVPAERLLPAELTDQSQPQGPTELAGRTWQRYSARGNQQALVLLEPTRTVLIVGDARDNELRELAAALR